LSSQLTFELYNNFVLAIKISTFFKKHRLLISLFFIAFIFRLAISPLSTHGDLTTQAEWGGWMYKNGPMGLYDWNQWISGYWPNHPPLISLVYLWAYQFHSFLMMCFSNLGNFIALNRLAPTKFLWFFAFTKWFGEAHFENSYFLKGIVLCIKFPMIIADIIIALIVYYLCKKNHVDWKKYVLAFLFLPFSWYLSALWGQSDQLSFIFLILSFILLNGSKKSWLSPLLFAISINLKPTGLILVPLYLWIWFRQRQSIMKLFFGGTIAILFTVFIVSLFTSKPPINYIFHELYTRIFLTLKPIITVDSLNFWRLFVSGKDAAITDDLVIQKITILGYIAYFFVSIVSFSVVKYKKIQSIFASLFISAFGGWLFLTSMHERYLFIGIASLLLLSIYRSKYFPYFIVLSTIYLIGMYLVFPAIPIPFLENNQIFSWLFSLVNILTYLVLTRQILKDFHLLSVSRLYKR